MHAYSAKRSSNDDAAKTRATLGPPARRAAAMRASISPRALTAAGGALNLAGVTASYQGRRRGSGAIPTREGCETPPWGLTGGVVSPDAWDRASIQTGPSQGDSSLPPPSPRAPSAARVDRR